MNDIKLGKTISYILRHHPEKYHVVLDEEGWVEIDLLLKAISSQFKGVKLDDILRIMEHSDKKRYQIKDHKIRAYYGHSFRNLIKKEKSQPPQYLYHGTSHKFIDSIKEKGLSPMKRQYVHYSTNKETAYMVGSRRDHQPIILVIDALKAYQDGIDFYASNDDVWLSKPLPPQYIIDYL